MRHSVALVGLALSGAVHLYLVPEHVALEQLLAGAFLMAGVAQVALAIGLALRAADRPLLLAGMLSVLLLLAYVLEVTVGLPLIGHAGGRQDHGGSELVLIAKAGEAMAVAAALMVRRPEAAP